MADHIPQEDILRVENIHTFIGQFHILEGVSVEVPTGSITVLLGRNGAGKTTTLKSILGITPPSQGSIVFEGDSLAGQRPFQIGRRGIGYVPEHRAIFHDLTVAGKSTHRRAQEGRFRPPRGADLPPVPGPQALLCPARREPLRRPAANAGGRPRPRAG